MPISVSISGWRWQIDVIHIPTHHFCTYGFNINQQSIPEHKAKDCYPFKHNLSGNYVLPSNITYKMKLRSLSYPRCFMRKLFQSKLKSMTLSVSTKNLKLVIHREHLNKRLFGNESLKYVTAEKSYHNTVIFIAMLYKIC